MKRCEYRIDIFRTVRKRILSDRQIFKLAVVVLESCKIKSAYIDVAIVGDKYMQKMTAEYSGRKYRTDVLAFDLGEDGDFELCGQIIVNAQLAREIANRLSVPASAELAMYIVHGLLHLTGFDDRNAEKARKMHEKTFTLLLKAGFKKLPPKPIYIAKAES